MLDVWVAWVSLNDGGFIVGCFFLVYCIDYLFEDEST